MGVFAIRAPKHNTQTTHTPMSASPEDNVGGEWIREEACSSDVVTWYPVEKVIWKGVTEFQDVVIADVPYFGRCLFLDNEIQSAEVDEDIYHECLVHPAMSAAMQTTQTSPLRVLVIGGGEGATVREVLRWDTCVSHITWVDIDGELVRACREHLQWAPAEMYENPKVTYFPMDIRVFFEVCADRFDVILVDLPDPDPAGDELQDGEFWRQVVAHLTATGVVATHTGPIRRRGPSGMTYALEQCEAAGMPNTPFPYHAAIASFQDDWGFCLFAPEQPTHIPAAIQEQLRFLKTPVTSMNYIFTWP
jgi:spermidine synthase